MGNYKTCGEEPIQPTEVMDLHKGYHKISNTTIKLYGLTKREHMAIEFTKAMLINPVYHEMPVTVLAKTAIDCAETLIKQLNETP